MTQDEYDDKIGWIDNHVYTNGLMSNGLIEDIWKDNWTEIFTHDIKIGSYIIYKQKKWKVISMHRLYGFLDVEASNGDSMTIVEVSLVEVCNNAKTSLPHFVSKLTENFELNTILETSDGRKIGNGFVSKELDDGYFEVTTQFNKLKLNEKELNELFHQPRYILKREHEWTV